jgi:hypothetical protein
VTALNWFTCIAAAPIKTAAAIASSKRPEAMCGVFRSAAGR